MQGRQFCESPSRSAFRKDFPCQRILLPAHRSSCKARRPACPALPSSLLLACCARSAGSRFRLTVQGALLGSLLQQTLGVGGDTRSKLGRDRGDLRGPLFTLRAFGIRILPGRFIPVGSLLFRRKPVERSPRKTSAGHLESMHRFRNPAVYERRDSRAPQVKWPAVMHRIAHELLCRSHVFHDIRDTAGLAKRARVIEQLDAHLWIPRIRVEVLHAVDREFFARRRGYDEVKSGEPIAGKFEDIPLQEFASRRRVGRLNQVYADTLPSSRGKSPAPSPAATKQ